MTTCSRCGQSLQYPIFINGISYGTDCAAKVMGMKELPYWFNEKSKDDFFVQKQKHEDFKKANQERHALSVELTKDAWPEFYILSKVFVNFRNKQNDWGMNFISSIANQLGFGNCLHTKETLFATYDEAILNWKEYMGTFPYLTHKPKSISELSPKQQAILNKYL